MPANPFIPFKGFTPSVDPSRPGAILDCANMVPTVRGMKSAPSPTPFGNPAFPSPATGAASCELLTGSYRTFVGTGTDLYEVLNSANNNVSAVAGAYTGTTNPWRFTQFGNATVATNGADPLQQSVSSGKFLPIGSVNSIQIKNGGAGFTSAPTVTIGAPASGQGHAATAVAAISGGALATVTITDNGGGYGYNEIPPVTFTGGGGSGETVTVVMQSAPIAAIVEVTQGFVFAFNTTDPVYGSRPHGWWCSGLYDQTDWYPSQSTQCENGVIVDQPGPITAAKALGTNIIVYKATSMFYGVYEGPPVVWAFNQISPQIGAPCQECVVGVTAVQYFLGTDKQVYVFDGNLPQPIGDEVHEWLAATWSSAHQQTVQSYYDETNSLIYWYFVSNDSSSGSIDTCLVYNHRTGKFGRADLAIEATVLAVSGQINWSQLGSLPGVTTWNTLPQIPYDSTYWSQAVPTQGVIDSSNTLQSLTGASGSSYITTGWLGDDYSYTDYLGFVPRFTQQPPTCTGVANTLPILGEPTPPTQWPIGPYYDGELAADFSARYAQLKLSFSGNHEILGCTLRLGQSGEI